MALVTFAEQPGTPPGIQLPNDCKQCRYFAATLDGVPAMATVQQLCCPTETYCPPVQLSFGAKSTKGRRPNMEDRDTIVSDFIQLTICHNQGDRLLPEALQAPDATAHESSSMDSIMSDSSTTFSNASSTWSDGSLEAYNNGSLPGNAIRSSFAYAAVFDGHGGSAVSTLLSKRLHLLVKQELEAMNAGTPFLTINNIASGLINSFLKMDSQLGDEAKTAGSTGVVTLVSQTHIVVANCGDSRAVLFRGQQEVRLSRDHKPTQPDEQERIVRAGGRVCNYNGIRVMGLLAMTRAFGDHCLSNFGITAEPEVTVIERHMNDEFVILASDGLWDVISDSEACALASRCFMRAQERKASSDTAARVAASVLMRVALEKGSSDNVTVVVVDLRN